MATSGDDTPLPRKQWLALLLVGIAVAAAALAWFVLHRPPADDGVLRINGRIEGDRLTVAPKLAGRVARLAVREGDRVQAGQLLVQLDDAAARARLEQVLAGVRTLQAQVAAQEASLALLRNETAVAIDAARARVSAAEAQLRRADAARDQLARDHERAADLSARGFVGPQALEQAALSLRQAREQQQVTHAALAAEREALRNAALGPQRVRAREAEAAVARARLGEAQAGVDEVRATLEDLTIRAPAAGTVTARFTDLGEVVQPGSPLLELTDLARVYLKGYLPEAQIGRVRIGMTGRIRVDAWPGQDFSATVRYVAARAEFTPKEVQTVDERVKLVYEVRLYADQDPAGRLNPGQPADGLLPASNERWTPSTP
jgi:HlyD family secretion protein